MSDSAVPVTMTGISYSTVLLGLLNVLFGGVLVAIIRTRPTLKKLANEREANLLEERAAEMELMRKNAARLEGEIRLLRHEVGNLTQCLDALLMMIEMDPAKAAEAAKRIKEMRAAQMVKQGAEKGAMLADNIKGAM